jgi:PEP-CTERM motif
VNPRHRSAAFAAVALAGLVAGPAFAAAPPAAGEICSHTTLSILPPPACIGSFIGGLDGSADEISLLKATWALDFTYLGRSDDTDNGPFAGNPQVAFNGLLAFDEKHSGQLVLALVSAGKHSYYFVNTKRNLGGLGFDSLEGVATTPQGNPFALDYAALYVAAVAVPEPGAGALLAAGLAALAWRRRQRG